MFSASGVTSQVMLPVQHLAGALHSLKTVADKGAIVWQSKPRCRKHTALKETHSERSQISVSLASIKEECSLSHLPESWIEDILPKPFKNSSRDVRWSTSYVSSETFFENKHGFKASDLQTNKSDLLVSPSAWLSSHHLCIGLNNLCSKHQIHHIQRRGFKTRRSENVHSLTSSGAVRKSDQETATTLMDLLFPKNIMNQLRSDFGFKKEPASSVLTQQPGTSPDSNVLGNILPNVQSAYDEHFNSSQQSHVKGQVMNYDSFKMGYYDGYVMARQGGSSGSGKEDFRGTLKEALTVRKLLKVIFIVCIPALIVALIVLRVFSDLGMVSSNVNMAATTTPVTFDDVRGIAEAKSELEEIVDYLKNPEKFTKLGGKLPKGVLLIGAPGTGKTLLARAVAGEADVPFFYASGSDFDHMFVGTGAQKVRDIFREAKAKAPCVIFIDELDSIGGKRIQSPNHPYARQTINQLLAEMDGFKTNTGVIVLGATNFPKSLDTALTRPGRFDINVTVPRPDVNGRIDILDLYLDKVKIASDVDKEILARGTVGFTGADLSNLVNQAALQAAKLNKDEVDMTDLEYAKDKILMGPERKSIIIDNKNKEITAFHEGGHALVAYFTKDAIPINKATIMPRGDSLGHVSLLPKKDQLNQTRSQLLAEMDICMGGRVAEEMIFGAEQITTGAGSDFDQATRIARLMITRFGMSDKLGVMTYSGPNEYGTTEHSEETRSEIEKEVRRLLEESYQRASSLLKTHSKEHRRLAEALLKHETLSADEVELAIKGKKIKSKH
ncbi:ATP-dependent zinc metalloprotease YME1L1-like [Amphiura filiformis]|uniref:ATP-dependent zinc metalloprotease YME1L1-like n=1 Tax=Amphiura filiformis TaxID=82378 RepID=UPI003B21C4D8